MDLPSHVVLMFMTSLLLFVMLRHFLPFVAIGCLVLIPAAFIIYESKPEKKH